MQERTWTDQLQLKLKAQSWPNSSDAWQLQAAVKKNRINKPPQWSQHLCLFTLNDARAERPTFNVWFKSVPELGEQRECDLWNTRVRVGSYIKLEQRFARNMTNNLFTSPPIRDGCSRPPSRRWGAPECCSLSPSLKMLRFGSLHVGGVINSATEVEQTDPPIAFSLCSHRRSGWNKGTQVTHLRRIMCSRAHMGKSHQKCQKKSGVWFFSIIWYIFTIQSWYAAHYDLHHMIYFSFDSGSSFRLSHLESWPALTGHTAYIKRRK